MLGEGSDLAAACKHLEVCEQTGHRWRNQYGGMKAEDAKRLKEQEKQNARPKKLVAEQGLDIDMLRKLPAGLRCRDLPCPALDRSWLTIWQGGGRSLRARLSRT